MDKSSDSGFTLPGSPHPTRRDSWTYEGRWLHSRRDPVAEAERAYQSAAIRRGDVLVLLGSGGGFLRQLAESRGHSVFAFNPAQLASWDPAASVISVNATISLPDEDPTLIKIVVPTAIRRAFPEWAEKLEAALLTQLQQRQASSQTIDFAADMWVRNAMANVRRFPTMAMLRPSAKMSTRGVIVAAAGPTLTRQLDAIREASLPVIAVLQAVPDLLNHGMVPAAVVLADGHPENARYVGILERSFLTQVPLVTTLTASAPAIRAWPGDVFWVSGGHPLEDRMMPHALHCTLDGTVLTVAINLARVMAKRGWIVGADLGFEGLHSHAAGASPHRSRLTAASRLRTYAGQAQMASRSLTTRQPGLIATNPAMKLYAERMGQWARPGWYQSSQDKPLPGWVQSPLPRGRSMDVLSWSTQVLEARAIVLRMLEDFDNDTAWVTELPVESKPRLLAKLQRLKSSQAIG